MSLDPFRRLTSRTIVLPEENIDTDQIIPARFLTTTTRDGLADACFYDWRFDAHGEPRAHVLNQTDFDEHKILISGRNFGCGSSREHAPWALKALGVAVVISTEIADIFRANALKNALLPICVSKGTHERLMASPGAQLTVDLESETISYGGETTGFKIEPFARYCLLQGKDSLEVLLDSLPEIEAFEARA